MKTACIMKKITITNFYTQFIKNKDVFLSLHLFFIISAFYIALKPLSKLNLFPFPSFFPFFEVETARYLLTSILGVSASILGITITILIISIQLLRYKFDDYAITAIFSNKKLKNSITLFVAIIVFSIITLIQLQSNSLSDFSYNQTYFIIFLFIYALIYFFIRIINIIGTTNSKKVLENLNEKIELKSFNNLSYANFFKNQDNLIEVIEEGKDWNPIIELQKISVLAAKNDDEIFFNQIINSRYKKLEKLFSKAIKDEQYCFHILCDVYQSYFVQPIAERLILNHNERLLRTLFLEIESLHVFFSKKGLLPLLSKSPLQRINNHLLVNIYDKLIEKNLPRSREELIYNYRMIMSSYLMVLDKPLDFSLLKLYNTTCGRDLSKNEVCVELENSLKEVLMFEFLSIVDKLYNIILKEIELKNIQIIKLICIFLNGKILEIVIGNCNYYLKYSNNTKFNISEVQKEKIITKIMLTLKNSFITGVNSNLFTIKEIDDFFGVSLLNCLEPVSISHIPIMNYLEAISIISEKHNIEEKNNDYFQKAIDHFLGNFDTHEKTIIGILFILEKTLSHVELRNYESVSSESDIIFKKVEYLSLKLKEMKIKSRDVNTQINKILKRKKK